MFYSSDLRHFEGIELDPATPAPAVRLAHYLRRLTRAATADGRAGLHATALPCRRRPGRKPCPGLLAVSLEQAPPRIHWECPECGEAGVIDGWKGSDVDLSTVSDIGSIGSEVRKVISRAGYQLLLNELIIDQDCERILYRARPHPDGVELSGPEDDFDVLMDAVASEAHHAINRSQRLRWNELYDQLEPKTEDPIEALVDVFADELSHFELVVGRAPVGELIRERIAAVAAQLGISDHAARGYMTEEVLRDLARDAAVELADERPGADLFAQPRNIGIGIGTIGRTLAALAESAHVRVASQDAVGAHGLLEMISLLGQILSQRSAAGSEDEVQLPQAAVTRCARLLEATAEMMTESVATAYELTPPALKQLALTFAEDSAILRMLVDEQGTGPSNRA